MKNDKEDNKLIEIVLIALYNDGSENGLHLNVDILIPRNIVFQQKEITRLKKLLTTTGFVNITTEEVYTRDYNYTDDTGLIHLNQQGYEMMMKFKSYSNFLKKQSKIESNDKVDRLLRNWKVVSAIAVALFSIVIGVITIINERKEIGTINQQLQISKQKEQQLSNQLDSIKLLLQKPNHN